MTCDLWPVTCDLRFVPAVSQRASAGMTSGWPLNNFLLTEREGRTAREILARGRGSTDLAQRGPYKNDPGPIFPSTAWTSSVSK